jgi:hypothetical protein
MDLWKRGVVRLLNYKDIYRGNYEKKSINCDLPI